MGRMLAAFLLTAFVHETQDRADLPQVVDTWYRVLQGKRQVGYFHETLQRASIPWRYEYTRDGELELTLRDRARHEEDHSVTAVLDESFAPIDLSLEQYANDSVSVFSLYSLRDERRIEARPLPTREPATWSVAARDDFHVLPTVTLYALRQNETLGRPGRVTLRAVDPRGEERAGMEVVLEVRETVRRTVLGKEVPGTPVVFRKPFPAPARETELRDAFVDRYGRILEATLGGGARIVIAADRTEALADVGPIHRHGRRDPMDKLAAMKNSARERRKALTGEPDPVGPLPTLDSLSSDLVGVQKLLEEVRARKAEGDLDEARKGYLQALVRLKLIRELAVKRRPEMVPDIEKTRDDAELAWNGAAQVAQDARTLFVQLDDQMSRVDCEGVERTHRELLALRDRIEVERRPEFETISDLVAEAGPLVVKCRTRRELAQARLQVTGVMMGEKTSLESVGGVEGIKFIHAFAWAEVNGQVYRAGDTIAGTQIRVDRITRHGVQVSLREELRDVGLRR